MRTRTWLSATVSLTVSLTLSTALWAADEPADVDSPRVKNHLDTPGAIVGLANKCLDVFMADPSDGAEVVLFECHGLANQIWTFEAVGSLVRVRGLADQCLQRDDSPNGQGFHEVEIGDCTDADSLWQFFGNNGSFQLIHATSGQCLDVLGSNTADGTPIITFGCSGNANQEWSFVTAGPAPTCVADATHLCLQGGRFRVEVNWLDFRDRRGPGTVVPGASSDSGLFWFFNPNNWEILVKVLDNCNGPTNRFWVFAAATTNVEYTLRVTDTVANSTKVYFNPLGRSSPAVTDTDAFATCP